MTCAKSCPMWTDLNRIILRRLHPHLYITHAHRRLLPVRRRVAARSRAVVCSGLLALAAAVAAADEVGNEGHREREHAHPDAHPDLAALPAALRVVAGAGVLH